MAAVSAQEPAGPVPRRTTVTLDDGRTLEALVVGEAGAPPFVFHHGTPGSAMLLPPLADAVLARGWRYVAPSRPGYGGSTASPGRDVARSARDTVQLLDRLGHAEFVTAGWSGGGPSAIACAALYPGRCRAAASLSGVAPYLADGIDWMSGMAKENVDEFTLALEDGPSFASMLDGFAEVFAALSPSADVSMRGLLGGLVCDADEAASSPPFVAELVRSCRDGLAAGTAGWHDDDRAFLAPWGVDTSRLEVPVAVWFGTDDLMVPVSHGEWLERHVAGARGHALPGEGHYSYLVTDPGRVLDELASMAGAPW